MLFTRTAHSVKLISLFVLGLLCAYVTLYSAHAADLTFSPSQGRYEEGRVFTVDVYVSNNNQSINAISGTVSFPSSKLSIRSVSKEGSIIKLWAEEPSYSNINGSVQFEGVILNPGYSGSRGKVLSITFISKEEGQAALSFANGEILANDGNATNVLENLGTASFQIAQQEEKTFVATPLASETTRNEISSVPAITSETHPDEAKWYNSRTVRFAWKLPESVTAVRTLYDNDPASTPTRVYDPPVSSRSFTTDEDGAFYMHVQFRTASGWGPASHRKFQIDTEDPTSIEVRLPLGDVTTDATPDIVVEAKDSLSGIERISVQVDDETVEEYAFKENNTYTLETLTPGKHILSITAYDKAGNRIATTREITIEKLPIPVITSYTKRAEYGSDIVVSGTSEPQKKVEVVLTDERGHSETKSATVDEKGDFILVWKDVIASGIYEMSARTMDENGATSDYTESRMIVIEDMRLIKIGMFIMNWLSLALIIILASVLVIATFWYSLTQFARFRRKVHQTMKEAEHTLKVNVQALRRDTEEFHTLLQKTEKKRELTKEEAAIMKKFKKRLDITEKEIERKLESIG
jgi:hypothetical protein